jgi:hypothetical protein
MAFVGLMGELQEQKVCHDLFEFGLPDGKKKTFRISELATHGDSCFDLLCARLLAGVDQSQILRPRLLNNSTNNPQLRKVGSSKQWMHMVKTWNQSSEARKHAKMREVVDELVEQLDKGELEGARGLWELASRLDYRELFTDDVLGALSTALEEGEGEEFLWCVAGAIWCLCMDPDVLPKLVHLENPRVVCKHINDSHADSHVIDSPAGGAVTGPPEHGEGTQAAAGMSERQRQNYAGCLNSFATLEIGRAPLTAAGEDAPHYRGLAALLHVSPVALEAAEALCNCLAAPDRTGAGVLCAELSADMARRVAHMAAGPSRTPKKAQKGCPPTTGEESAKANAQLRFCAASVLGLWAKERSALPLLGDPVIFPSAARCLQFALDSQKDLGAAQACPEHFTSKKSFYSHLLRYCLTALHGCAFALGDIPQGRPAWVAAQAPAHDIACSVSGAHLHLLLRLAAPPRTHSLIAVSRTALSALACLAHTSLSVGMLSDSATLRTIASHVSGWMRMTPGAVGSIAPRMQATRASRLSQAVADNKCSKTAGPHAQLEPQPQLACLAMLTATGLALLPDNRAAMWAAGMPGLLAAALTRMSSRAQLHSSAGLMLLCATAGTTSHRRTADTESRAADDANSNSNCGGGRQGRSSAKAAAAAEPQPLPVPSATRDEVRALVQSLALGNVSMVHFAAVALWSLARRESNRKLACELGAPALLLGWMSQLMVYEAGGDSAAPGMRAQLAGLGSAGIVELHEFFVGTVWVLLYDAGALRHVRATGGAQILIDLVRHKAGAAVRLRARLRQQRLGARRQQLVLELARTQHVMEITLSALWVLCHDDDLEAAAAEAAAAAAEVAAAADAALASAAAQASAVSKHRGSTGGGERKQSAAAQARAASGHRGSTGGGERKQSAAATATDDSPAPQPPRPTSTGDQVQCALVRRNTIGLLIAVANAVPDCDPAPQLEQAPAEEGADTDTTPLRLLCCRFAWYLVDGHGRRVLACTAAAAGAVISAVAAEAPAAEASAAEAVEKLEHVKRMAAAQERVRLEDEADERQVEVAARAALDVQGVQSLEHALLALCCGNTQKQCSDETVAAVGAQLFGATLLGKLSLQLRYKKTIPNVDGVQKLVMALVNTFDALRARAAMLKEQAVQEPALVPLKQRLLHKVVVCLLNLSTEERNQIEICRAALDVLITLALDAPPDGSAEGEGASCTSGAVEGGSGICFPQTAALAARCVSNLQKTSANRDAMFKAELALQEVQRKLPPADDCGRARRSSVSGTAPTALPPSAVAVSGVGEAWEEQPARSQKLPHEYRAAMCKGLRAALAGRGKKEKHRTWLDNENDGGGEYGDGEFAGTGAHHYLPHSSTPVPAPSDESPWNPNVKELRLLAKCHAPPQAASALDSSETALPAWDGDGEDESAGARTVDVHHFAVKPGALYAYGGEREALDTARWSRAEAPNGAVFDSSASTTVWMSVQSDSVISAVSVDARLQAAAAAERRAKSRSVKNSSAVSEAWLQPSAESASQRRSLVSDSESAGALHSQVSVSFAPLSLSVDSTVQCSLVDTSFVRSSDFMHSRTSFGAASSNKAPAANLFGQHIYESGVLRGGPSRGNNKKADSSSRSRRRQGAKGAKAAPRCKGRSSRDKKPAPLVHYYVKRLLHEAVEELEPSWLQRPPQPDALFDWCACEPQTLRGWPLPQPPDVRQPPPPYRPQARAALHAPDPRFGELPPDSLAVPVEWDIRPPPEPEPELLVGPQKTQWPEMLDIDGDGITDEVDLDGDGDLETVVRITVGAKIELASKTLGSDLFYSVDGTEDIQLPTAAEIEAYGVGTVREYFRKGATERYSDGHAYEGNAKAAVTAASKEGSTWVLGAERGAKGASGRGIGQALGKADFGKRSAQGRVAKGKLLEVAHKKMKERGSSAEAVCVAVLVAAREQCAPLLRVVDAVASAAATCVRAGAAKARKAAESALAQQGGWDEVVAMKAAAAVAAAMAGPVWPKAAACAAAARAVRQCLDSEDPMLAATLSAEAAVKAYGTAADQAAVAASTAVYIALERLSTDAEQTCAIALAAALAALAVARSSNTYDLAIVTPADEEDIILQAISRAAADWADKQKELAAEGTCAVAEMAAQIAASAVGALRSGIGITLSESAAAKAAGLAVAEAALAQADSTDGNLPKLMLATTIAAAKATIAYDGDQVATAATIGAAAAMIAANVHGGTAEQAVEVAKAATNALGLEAVLELATGKAKAAVAAAQAGSALGGAAGAVVELAAAQPDDPNAEPEVTWKESGGWAVAQTDTKCHNSATFGAKLSRLLEAGAFKKEDDFPGPIFGPIGSPYEDVILYAGPIQSDDTGSTSGLPLGTTQIYARALHPSSSELEWLPSDVQECVVSVVSGWSLEKSIWQQRPKSCDSQDYYDAHKVQKRTFAMDWSRMYKKPSTVQFIARVVKMTKQKGYTTAEDIDKETAEIKGEVQLFDPTALQHGLTQCSRTNVSWQVWEVWDVINQSFDFYAACSGGSGFQVRAAV